MSGPIPIWPLPLDFQNAGEHIREYVSSSWVACPDCSTLLQDATMLERHRSGKPCQRGAELMRMNAEGYHVFLVHGGDPSPQLMQLLRPIMRQGDFYKFYTAPVASFLRWIHVSGKRSRRRKDATFNLLKAFIEMDEQTQVNQLMGEILVHEYKMDQG